MYANEYAMTKSILQKAGTLARKEVFGEARVNAKYILALQDELELRGHFVEVILTTRQDAIHRMMLVVLAEEVRRRKAAKQVYSDISNPHGARQYCIQWSKDNEDFINEQFGRVEDKWRFVHGILFATSKRTAPALQNVIQADAAHMKFGKYTLYSAYGSTANAQCSPIAFAILFGNEDTDAWTKFWTFARGVHPWLDNAEKTIITNQDKGSSKAISAVLPLAHNFHCSFHHRTNIMKKCKGGAQMHKGLWLFNMLVKAKTMDEITAKRNRNRGLMAETDFNYVGKIPDNEQYPAARCAMGSSIIM